MPAILLYAITSLLYAALGVHFWRTRWTGGGGAASGEEGASNVSWERLAILAPVGGSLFITGWVLVLLALRKA